MSYILQGSGSLLGPCLANLLGREVTRHAPCICLRCAQLLSTSAQQQPAAPGTFAQQQNAATAAAFKAAAAAAAAERLPEPTVGVSSLAASDRAANFRQTLAACSRPLVQYHLAESMGLGPLGGAEMRRRFPSATFQQKYFTNFSAPLPFLGHGGPVNVNLTFLCDPGVSHTGIQYRFLHTAPVLEKKAASSKVEETVNRLKERQQEALSQMSQVEDLEKKVATVIETDQKISEAVKETPDSKKLVPKKSLWDRFVDECKHYYSGFKLLFLDVRVSSQIVWKVLNGYTLSRRESRQLVRTVSDLFRLVPFSVFIVVPFMELLLPLALKLFPGMLPSTFTSQDEKEVKMRRALKAKLEYAKFLQQTLDEMGPTGKGHKSQSARDFVSFYNEVKQKKVDITNKDILKFSKLFEDEITLDNMTRGQLVAICRLLELTPIGTNAFLRFQIEMQLRKLKADDKMISREGIENLSVAELQTACKDRGMRAVGLTQDKLRQQLKQWIELSTNEKVPPSLLLLSRTLYLPETLDTASQIAAAVSVLPETAATGAKAKLGEWEGKIENVTRLELIRAEQKKIEEEALEQERLEEERKKKAEEEKEKKARLTQVAMERAIDEQSRGFVPPPSPPTLENIVSEGATILRKATVSPEGDLRHTAASLSSAEVAEVLHERKASKAKSFISEELSPEDLAALRAAVEGIMKEKGSSFINEHDVLHEVKQELTDYEEDLGELAEQAAKSGRGDLRQSKGAARLFKRINTMLNRMDGVVKNLETREKALESQIDQLGHVGVSTGDREGHLVTVQDLLQAVRALQEVPDSERLERISEVVAKMDEDSDGVIRVEHVNKVVEILGRDNVQISPKQVKQIIELIGKEELIEVENRIEKVLGKLPSMPSIQTLEEQLAKETLVDKAKDLSEEDAEAHIAKLIRPVRGADQQPPRSLPAEEPEQAAQQTATSSSTSSSSKPAASQQEDNSVRELTEQVAPEKEEVEKITRKNGSKH